MTSVILRLAVMNSPLPSEERLDCCRDLLLLLLLLLLLAEVTPEEVAKPPEPGQSMWRGKVTHAGQAARFTVLGGRMRQNYLTFQDVPT